MKGSFLFGKESSLLLLQNLFKIIFIQWLKKMGNSQITLLVFLLYNPLSAQPFQLVSYIGTGQENKQKNRKLAKYRCNQHQRYPFFSFVLPIQPANQPILTFLTFLLYYPCLQCSSPHNNNKAVFYFKFRLLNSSGTITSCTRQYLVLLHLPKTNFQCFKTTFSKYQNKFYFIISTKIIHQLQEPELMADKNHKLPLGVTRSRFNQLLKAKGKRSLSKKRFSKASLRKNIDDDEIVQSALLSYSTKTSQLQLTEIAEPTWMNDYRKCCMIFAEVDSIMEQVKEERAKKLVAINEQKHKKIIERCYSEATAKIGECQKILKGIEKNGDLQDVPEQRKFFANTLMSIAMKIRERAKQIRQGQQQDLRQRQQFKRFEGPLFEGDNIMNKDLNEEGQFLTQQAFQAMEQQLFNERNEQILKIVTSIHSLNTIYKQLQDVVIQQGSLLDRIDQNIENAAFNIKEANQHLSKAEEHQKSPLANRVIFILLLLIVALTLFLAFR